MELRPNKHMMAASPFLLPGLFLSVLWWKSVAWQEDWSELREEKRVSETWGSGCKGMASWHKLKIQGNVLRSLERTEGRSRGRRRCWEREQAWQERQWWPRWDQEGEQDLGLGWAGHTEVIWTWGHEGLGATGERKEGGKRRWSWVLSRSRAGMDGLASHCAGFKFSGVLSWRQGTTFYI